MAQSDNHTARTTTSARTDTQLIYCVHRPRRWKNFCCPRYWHKSLSTLLNLQLSAETLDMHCTFVDHSRHCCRLNEQCSSRSIWQLQSTMCTINNCSIVSSTRTYRQQSVAGSATMCRTDEPRFIFGRKYLNSVRCKQEWYMEEFCLQLSSITIWPTFQHRPEHQADQVRRWHYHLHIRISDGWPNQWPQHILVASAQLHKKTLQCQRPNLQ